MARGLCDTYPGISSRTSQRAATDGNSARVRAAVQWQVSGSCPGRLVCSVEETDMTIGTHVCYGTYGGGVNWLLCTAAEAARGARPADTIHQLAL